MSLIHFNVPPFVGTEFEYMKEAVERHKISGDGLFSQKCSEWMQDRFDITRAMLTTSGSSALDMAALLCDITPGDEVILPSYTFPSTANAFVLAGARLVFVDIRPDTMNIDENKIEEAITDRTKVLVVMHYAGVSCEMDAIMEIAKKHSLKVVEDAAQGIMSRYKNRALGSIGDFGCFSFHETKNFSMGEGGAILVNDQVYIERAEILREKGTNRSKYFRGEIAKYNWVDYGDSFLPSDMNAAYLWAQLQNADEILENRMCIWNKYYSALQKYENSGKIRLPYVPGECVHNAHMFYIKLPNYEIRQAFIDYMRENDILCVFHYVPLHSAPAGLRYGRFFGEDRYTTSESDKLVRLPIYYNMDVNDQNKVIEKAVAFLDRV